MSANTLLRRWLSVPAIAPPWPKFNVSAEVRSAIKNGEPVVALESTIITHGMPYPRNVATATAVEAAVRKSGAVPATVAIVDGVISVGLSPSEIERLGTMGPGDVGKCSRRDFGPILAQRRTASTTVASTM